MMQMNGNGMARALLVAAIVAVFALALSGTARAEIRKEVRTLTVDSGTSESAFVVLANDGTITKAVLVVPTCTSTTKTLTLTSWNGATIGEIEIATATTTSTGDVTLTDLANVSAAGDVRARVYVDSNEAADRTFYLLMFIEK